MLIVQFQGVNYTFIILYTLNELPELKWFSLCFPYVDTWWDFNKLILSYLTIYLFYNHVLLFLTPLASISIRLMYKTYPHLLTVSLQ